MDLDGEKEVIVHFKEPMKALCIEGDTNGKRDRSFVVGDVGSICIHLFFSRVESLGGSSGQLIYHRTVWFSQKNAILFNGAGSAVSVITWKNDLIAWADFTHVRLMNISTQSAICYLECPAGVSVQYPFPCSLFWESDRDLWIGWADNCRHLELVFTKSAEGTEVVARTVHEWQADCIICGLSSFDAEHLMLLGYLPADEDAFALLPENNERYYNHPEFQIVRRLNGKISAADVLPLKGEVVMSGPWGFNLLSTYNGAMSADARRWSIKEAPSIRGGLRALDPVAYIVSPQDLVVAKVILSKFVVAFE